MFVIVTAHQDICNLMPSVQLSRCIHPVSIVKIGTAACIIGRGAQYQSHFAIRNRVYVIIQPSFCLCFDMDIAQQDQHQPDQQSSQSPFQNASDSLFHFSTVFFKPQKYIIFCNPKFETPSEPMR